MTEKNSRKYTEARKAANVRWDKQNLDRISIAVKQGKRDEIKAAAAAQSESMNAYITGAIDQRMEREKKMDGGGKIENK